MYALFGLLDHDGRRLDPVALWNRLSSSRFDLIPSNAEPYETHQDLTRAHYTGP